MGDTPEYVLDGVRGWLIFSEGPRDMKNLRFFARRSPHCAESDVPDEWKNFPDEVHVTKSMLAEVLYRAFRRAEQELEAAQDSVQRSAAASRALLENYGLIGGTWFSRGSRPETRKEEQDYDRH